MNASSHSVLAGKLGTEGLEGLSFKSGRLFSQELPYDSVPVFIGTPDGVLAKIKPVPGHALAFRSEGLGFPKDVTLAPSYTIDRQRYSVYWQLQEHHVKTGKTD